MNTYSSNTAFEDYSAPTLAVFPSLKPVPASADLDEDTQRFSVLYPTKFLPAHDRSAEEHHTVLDVDSMVVPSSLIRRIENELLHDQCDPRTVFHFCRGLARGTHEFENAYISARIRSFAKHQRIVTNPIFNTPSDHGNLPDYPFHTIDKDSALPQTHPMAVNHLGHLMNYFGIWVIGLLGIQFFAAWKISTFADTYLVGGRLFHFAIALFLMLILDSAVWFRWRGRLFDDFIVPGFVLFLLTLLPIIILHVRGSMLAAYYLSP